VYQRIVKLETKDVNKPRIMKQYDIFISILSLYRQQDFHHQRYFHSPRRDDSTLAAEVSENCSRLIVSKYSHS
jgi:hypothetical protein